MIRLSRRAISLIVMTGIFLIEPVAGQGQSPLHTGGWIIAGTGSFGRSHDDASGTDVTHFAVAPVAQTFVTPHLAVGGSLALGYVSTSQGNSYTFGAGPGGRYYFVDSASRTLPFVAASVMPQWQHAHVTGGSTPAVDSHSSIVAVDGSVGITRLLVRHVGLTGEAYYTHSASSSGPSSNTTTRTSYDIGLRTGLTIFVH